MEDDKKVKLEELQDETEAPLPQELPKPTPRPKSSKETSEAIKKLNSAATHEDKMTVAQRHWYFDRPVRHWTWLVIMIIIAGIHFSPMNQELSFTLNRPSEDLFDIGKITMISDLMQLVSRYFILLIFIVPIFFKFKSSSSNHFTLDVFGIETVRDLTKDHELSKFNLRFRVKWQEIVEAKLTKLNRRDIIQITLNDHSHAVIIWDIPLIDKKVICKLLTGFVSKDHPLRILIEKDLS